MSDETAKVADVIMPDEADLAEAYTDLSRRFWITLDRAHKAEDSVSALRAENAELRKALERIAEGKGAFSFDNETHANNVITEANATAKAALAFGLSPETSAASSPEARDTA